MRGRRITLSQRLFDNYVKETEENRAICQEVVLDYYYRRNDNDLELAFEEIREDLKNLEINEHYERCSLLKDILDNFE